MLPKQSEMMELLYGKELAATVYQRCQSLSPKFNELVQSVVYDVIWQRSGLTLCEKSLSTIVTLMVLGKEEQLKIHLLGFFNLGGTPQFIQRVAEYLQKNSFIENTEKIRVILEDTLDGSWSCPQDEKFNFTCADQSLVEFSAYITLGNNELTKSYLKTLLSNGALTKDQIEDIMLHIMMYCGFPCAMNGFAMLREVLD
jgi:alkylhydroperoxidase/carboxymuconolactone decarboxylase family protein YurZ